ncbi:MAG: hypothetical protein QXP36_05785, partial [Conexivisphaerales archaeon]
EGLLKAKQDYILNLDSDQIVSEKLLEKLNNVRNDMAIIAEKSYNNNLIGKLMDYKRDYLFKYSKSHPSPFIPVIPRFYKKKLALDAFESITNFELKNIIQHEDSLLYYEAFKLSKNIGFVDDYLYNIDPPLNLFLKKSYTYGSNMRTALKSNNVLNEHKQFFRKLDEYSFLFEMKIGINKGIIINFIKGLPYFIGYLKSGELK